VFPITLDHFGRLHVVLKNNPPLPLDLARRIVSSGFDATVQDAVLCVCRAHVMVRIAARPKTVISPTVSLENDVPITRESFEDFKATMDDNLINLVYESNTIFRSFFNGRSAFPSSQYDAWLAKQKLGGVADDTK
jgi:hypothetical protein